MYIVVYEWNLVVLYMDMVVVLLQKYINIVVEVTVVMVVVAAEIYWYFGGSISGYGCGVAAENQVTNYVYIYLLCI